MTRILGVLLVLLLANGSQAEVEKAKVDKKVSQTILSRLQESLPEVQLGEVSASPMPHVYQVQINNGPLLYVSGDGKYVINGRLLGTADGGLYDVRERELEPVRRDKLAAIPASEEVIFPAQGKRKASIYVFTDVDCGYCRKLHQEVPELNAMGVEVRYLAYPRAGVNSESARKIAQAWCAKDRQDTMTRLKNRESVEVAYCEDNPVAEQYRLGSELGVSGTPAVFSEDGVLLGGYLSAEALVERIGI